MLLRLIGITLLLAGLLSGCRSRQDDSTEILRPVRFQRVEAAGEWMERTFAGTAQAGLESRLSFRVPGAILELPVKVGVRVAAGQLIARLDPTDYQLQVQEAAAALARTQAQARNADAAYERVRALYENRNASRSDLDAARAASESAAAAVRAGATGLALSRSQLGYTRLTAPTDGAIASVTVEVNENVAAGQVVVILTSGELPEVTVAIPETQIHQIRRGDTVQVRFDAIDRQLFPATVTEVGVATLGQATTFPVRVRLKEANPRIHPGMAGEVRFRFPRNGESSARFLVPPEAVGEDREGRFVFLLSPAETETGVIHRQTVTVGELTPAGLEIMSGLKDGNLVVTAGVSLLGDGQKVKLLGSEGKAP